MLNTLRSVVNDDAKWFADIHEFYQQFKYKQIATADVVQWWSTRTGMDLKPFFDEYLRHAELPVLQIRSDSGAQTVAFRWKAAEPGFAMPVEVGRPGHWTRLQPVTTEWITKPASAFGADLNVAADKFYVNVEQVSDGARANPAGGTHDAP